MESSQSRTSLPQLQCNTPRAMNTSDLSDEEDIDDRQILAEDAEDAEDAEYVVGISIGREQSRLTSPRTPAVEKSEAIRRSGGFFSDVPGHDVPEKHLDYKTRSSTANLNGLRLQTRPGDPTPSVPDASTNDQLPSPWRAKPRTFERTSQTRAILSNGSASRQRSSSGSEFTFDSLQKRLLALPKKFSPFSSEEQPPAVAAGTVSRADFHENPGPAKFKVTSGQPSRPLPERLPTNKSHLRHSASDDSLILARTLSRTSSLGDDSRFAHVQAQVNSRMKAIRDTWQESNIKLPSISSMRPDFLRDKTNPQDERNRTSTNSKMGASMPVDPFTRQPYHSAKAATDDVIGDRETSHPFLSRALSMLDGDIVVLGGYRGSVLRSAQPPHKQLWVPIKVGLNLRKVDLEVGIEEGDDEKAAKDVIPGGMLTHIGPVDVSRRLLKRLHTCGNAREGKLRVHEYGYDWRLDPNLLSERFCRFVENLPCNKPSQSTEKRGATIIAHSLGGLITRHAVNQRPELFRGVIYAGVPNTCVNILGPLRNGDDVMLSSKVLTAQVNFTIRTSFALLPLDGRCFVDKDTQEEYLVDFFDPKTWLEYRLSPCVARPLPALKQAEPSGITGYVSSVAKALPSLPLPRRKNSLTPWRDNSDSGSKIAVAGGIAEPDMSTGANVTRMSSADGDSTIAASVSTAVSITREDALAYLARTLAKVKRFKQELAFRSDHADEGRYPPVAVIYGKNTPTVIGAKVSGRERIKCADAYDELAFASGDGVVLAKAAMVPEGYSVARGGLISSERGHVTLLGDLEAVGKCLNAVITARRAGTGRGV